MILACPKCNARFLVPDTAIGANGRNVRCGKCAHNWFTMPRGEAPAAAAGAPDIDKLMREGAVRTVSGAAESPPLKPIPPGSNLPVRLRRFGFGRRLRLYAAGLAVVLTAAAVGAGLVDLAPTLVGLPDSHGLAFADMKIQPAAPAGTHAGKAVRFVLEGNITNKTQATLAEPDIRIALLNHDGREIRRWWRKGQHAAIAAGGKVPFSIPDLDIPREDGMRLRLDMGNWLELALRPVQ